MVHIELPGGGGGGGYGYCPEWGGGGIPLGGGGGGGGPLGGGGGCPSFWVVLDGGRGGWVADTPERFSGSKAGGGGRANVWTKKKWSQIFI